MDSLSSLQSQLDRVNRMLQECDAWERVSLTLEKDQLESIIANYDELVKLEKLIEGD